MGNIVIILLVGIIIILWRFSSKSNNRIDQLIDMIESENKRGNGINGYSTKDYLVALNIKIHDISEGINQLISIASIEHPAGAKYHGFARSDNLSKLYADYLEQYENLPRDLALKQAPFEIAQFGQNTIIRKINSDFFSGIEQQRKRKYSTEFFTSGIVERAIESRLKNGIIPCDLFAPLYDLVLKQDYSGEKDFAADLTDYEIETYDEMIARAAIISKLEQMAILLRTGGDHWGELLRFRLKSIFPDDLRDIIYSGEVAHDDEYFEERFKQGGLPRIFDAHHLSLISQD